MSQNIKFKALSNVNIKAEGDDFTIEGYASVFGTIDSDNDIVEKGAFLKTIQEMGGRIALCYQHSLYNPIGKITKLEEDNYGLKFEARISDAEPGIKQKIKEGILKEFSIGYSVIKYDTDNVQNQRPINRLKELKLWEISLVTLAANQYATLQAMKSAFGIESIEDEFDAIIATEKNQTKKFELLKLKHIALAAIEPGKITHKDEPPFSQDEVNNFKSLLTLI